MAAASRPKTSQHSLRCEDVAWEKAKRRAEYEGRTISSILAIFAKGYGEGLVDLPHVVYSPPREKAS